LKKDHVVIFAGGTGNPFFTTDTAASLRAMEIKADIILKGTKVDGVYTSDPVKDKDAVKIDKLTHWDVLERKLNVMDATAITLASEQDIPIVVYNLRNKGDLKRIILGEEVGTLVSKTEE
ncbi:MAG: uridine monophosphate kinase, partial [Nitrospinae bacterium]|nr:uridine monophosphate kinase [Nitrospinota bacterium]